MNITSETNSVNCKAFDGVIEKMVPGASLLRAWELDGGVSARTVAVEFVTADGETEKAVVRLHGDADRAGNPDIAADEFRLLEIVQAAGIPAPGPLFLDRSCELFDIPYLVISFIEGTSDTAPIDMKLTAEMMAGQLAAIHLADLQMEVLSFLPTLTNRAGERLRRGPVQLDERLSEAKIRAALEAAWPPTPANAAVLLHGDYWPGNILWEDGEIAGVIDWEDAATGDPLADLGNCRLELLWASGTDAMDAFTVRYRSLMPSLDYTTLSLWDLYAALHPAGKLWSWGLEADQEARMAGAHRRFVGQALDALAGNGEGL